MQLKLRCCSQPTAKEQQMSTIKTALVATCALAVAAYVAGQFSTKAIITEIEIDAPPSAVWAVLSDTAAHAEWNPFIRSIAGPLQIGGRLTVTIEPPDNAAMQIKPMVLVATENEELRWIGRLGFRGIFDGEHYFILEETDRGTTRFLHGENFSGMIVYPLMAFIGTSTEQGFNAMNAALKERVESGL